MLLAVLSLALAVQSLTLDRLVAVVNGQPITLSDLRAVRGMELVPDARTLDHAALVDRLIERELMRAEVDRFSIAPPDAEQLDARLARIAQRLGSGNGGKLPGDALEALGLSPGRLRAWVEDDLRIERYLRQRFDAAAQPSDEEALAFFRSREREFMVGGRPQPFAAVRDEVRARLAGERRRELIDDWTAALRRRATIVVVPPPSGGEAA